MSDVKNDQNVQPEMLPKPTLGFAILPIAITVILMIVQLIVFDDFTPHIPLAFGIAFTGILAWSWGYTWKQMEAGLFHVIHIGLPAIAILMVVGMIVGTWMLSGTVPIMIFYGLKLISPELFLLTAMVICSVISLATGTSWGTIGTVGIALVGIGQALGIPPGLTGGAVVSGAYFGDKISPLSDTTNLAPAVCDTELFAHIKNLLATTVPSMIIAGILYLVLGMKYTGDAEVIESIEKITQVLESTFQFTPLLLIPAVVVIVMALKRMPAIPTLFTGAVLGGLTAMIAQGASLHDVFAAMQNGFSSNTGLIAVDKLLSKGGIQSMMWVISLLLIALGFGGMIEKTRCLEVILDSILKKVKSRFGLVAASTGTAIGLNVFAGDPYLAIALPGRMYAPAYRGMGLSTLNLSRSIEEGGTLVNPLVPWNAGGAFVAGSLGIETLVYAPFAFACWISPLIGLLYGYTGWFMPKASEVEKQQWIDEESPIIVDGQLVSLKDKTITPVL